MNQELLHINNEYVRQVSRRNHRQFMMSFDKPLTEGGEERKSLIDVRKRLLEIMQEGRRK